MNANIISLPLGKQQDYLKLGYGVLIEIIAPSTLSNRKKVEQLCVLYLTSNKDATRSLYQFFLLFYVYHSTSKFAN